MYYSFWEILNAKQFWSWVSMVHHPALTDVSILWQLVLMFSLKRQAGRGKKALQTKFRALCFTPHPQAYLPTTTTGDHFNKIKRCPSCPRSKSSNTYLNCFMGFCVLFPKDSTGTGCETTRTMWETARIIAQYGWREVGAWETQPQCLRARWNRTVEKSLGTTYRFADYQCYPGRAHRVEKVRSSPEALVILKLKQLAEENEPMNDSEEERLESQKGNQGRLVLQKAKRLYF